MSLSKFRLRGFQRLSDAVVDSLGELEQKVLESVRQGGECSVSHICSALDDAYAYTTVMTTLDRLFKKGLLDRRKDGRAFYYKAKYSQAEIERTVTEDVISSLLEGSIGRAEPILACIVDSVSSRDRDLLDELERLVQEKRAQLDNAA